MCVICYNMIICMYIYYYLVLLVTNYVYVKCNEYILECHHIAKQFQEHCNWEQLINEFEELQNINK